MSKVENLKVGDWIVLTKVNTVSHPTQIPGVYSESYPYCCNGMPLKILAINFPWIAVTDTRYVGTIDSRLVYWTKASKEYLKALGNVKLVPETENFINLWYTPEARAVNKICPNCGNPLTQRKDLLTDWELYCKECHFKGAIHD